LEKTRISNPGADTREHTMSKVSVRLPESLHKYLREFAQREGILVNQLAALALSEKMAALA